MKIKNIRCGNVYTFMKATNEHYTVALIPTVQGAPRRTPSPLTAADVLFLNASNTFNFINVFFARLSRDLFHEQLLSTIWQNPAKYNNYRITVNTSTTYNL